MGLQLSPKQIYDANGGGLARAIVSLGGGTGSFVSPNALILTNHHVAFGALQRTSTAEHNYIADGFNAASYEEEIPAPKASAWKPLAPSMYAPAPTVRKSATAHSDPALT